MKNGIIWLSSYPKSGNTWLRAFLVNYIENASIPVNINDLGKIPAASTKHLFEEFAGVESDYLTLEETLHARPAVYSSYARAEGTIALGGYKIFKIHDAYTYNASGQPLFPREVTRGVIYIIRNPLDVVVSLTHHNSSTHDLTIQAMADDDFALSWAPDRGHWQLRQRLKSWSGHVTSWNDVPNLARLLIRYEDMINDTFNTFGSVVRFLGFDDDEERLQRAIHHSSFDVLKTQEETHGFKEGVSQEFFRRGAIGNWREHLTTEQAVRVVSQHHAVMLRYGYLTASGEIVF